MKNLEQAKGILGKNMKVVLDPLNQKLKKRFFKI